MPGLVVILLAAVDLRAGAAAAMDLALGAVVLRAAAAAMVLAVAVLRTQAVAGLPTAAGQVLVGLRTAVLRAPAWRAGAETEMIMTEGDPVALETLAPTLLLPGQVLLAKGVRRPLRSPSRPRLAWQREFFCLSAFATRVHVPPYRVSVPPRSRESSEGTVTPRHRNHMGTQKPRWLPSEAGSSQASLHNQLWCKYAVQFMKQLHRSDEINH